MAQLKTLTCPHCRGEMIKGTSRGLLHQLVALLFLVVAVIVCLYQLYVGLALIVLVLLLDGSAKKFWKCKRCGSVIERA